MLKYIPYVIVYNKSDLVGNTNSDVENEIYVSAKDNINITELKDLIAKISKRGQANDRRIVGDIISPGDVIVLVTPIDSAAPKGRLILPQQQTIRDILEAGCIPVCCRDTELTETLSALTKKPAMVITDSQAFGKVNKILPKEPQPLRLQIRYRGRSWVLQAPNDRRRS